MKPKVYVKNRLKPTKAFFDWCLDQLPVYVWENKKERIVSSDRKSSNVITKRLTTKSKLDTDWQFNSFAIVLVTSKRIEIQSYAHWFRLVDGKEDTEIELVNLEVFKNNKHLTFGKGYYDIWTTGLVSNYGFMSGPYQGTKFYDNNWERAIAEVSEMRFIDFSDFEIERYYLDRLYKYRVEIEYLQKIKANRMAEEVMYGGRVDMRTLNKKWLKDNKPFIRKSEKSFREYELEQRIKKRNGKVVEGIHKYLDYQDINKIPKEVGIIRFQNWVIKNEVDMDYYFDYLHVLKDLEVTPDTENLIIPKDLKIAHDNAVDLLNQKKRDIELKEFEERKQTLKRMDMAIGGYVFIVPKQANELISEGKQLSHCVGGSHYVNNHAKGKTTVVFLRDEKEPNKSLYTIEYKNKEIVQCRGKRNESAPQEIMNIVNEWQQVVESPRART